MKNLKELRQKAKALSDEQDTILHAADEEKRALTADERSEYDRLKEEREALEATIAIAEEQEKVAKRLAEPATKPVKPEEIEGRETPEGKVGEDRAAAKPFRNIGEQLVAIRNAALTPHDPDKRLLHIHEEYRAASGLSEAVPADGGFLVQKDFVAELLKRTYETGAILSRVRRNPVGPNANGIKVNAIDETSRADGSRLGGVRGYWTNEAATMTASKPKFRQIDMSLEKVTALLYATDELLDDGVALSALVSQALPEELTFKVEDAIINGDGAGKPLGILNAGCLATQAKETGQAAATVVFENISNMWSRGFSRNRLNMVWLMNQEIEPQLDLLTIPGGTAAVPAYMPPGGISQAPYGTLKGRPVIPVEYTAALGTVGDLILADLGEYLLIDKGGVAAAQSIHVRFLFEETTFRWSYRVNGQPIWNSALTPFKGSSTLSPFVALATRA